MAFRKPTTLAKLSAVLILPVLALAFMLALAAQPAAAFADSGDLQVSGLQAQAAKNVLNKTTVCTVSGDPSKVRYYKVVVPKRGYITLKVEGAPGSYGYSNARLCDSKKKTLIGDIWNYVGSKGVCYGVKKGTYYIAVQSTHSSYSITPKFTAVARGVKMTQAKATAIKKGKKVSAVMAAGENAAWYKFNVTKKGACTFAISGKLCAGMGVVVYSGNNRIASSYLDGNVTDGVDSRTFSTGKLAKGTYYIEFYPSMAYGTNGLFTITWKK